MSTYSVSAAKVVEEYADTSFNMIDIVIRSDDGRFVDGALSYHVAASDGTATVDSFMAWVSQNGKELHAFFTTDAFAGMSGPAEIELSYGEELVETIGNVNVAAILTPLPALFATGGFPDADNAWLAAL